MNTSATRDLRLYELALADGRSASPFVWRIRYALAHKGLNFDAVPLGFTEIAARFEGRFKTVPILEHGGTVLSESWDIALYLDSTFPERRLFSNATEVAMVRFMDTWFLNEVMRRMFRVCIKDVHDRARPQDQAYFRQSREKSMKGATLESFTEARAAHLPELRTALKPLRTHLTQFPFLGGEQPNYADYIGLSGFIWAATVTTLPVLAADDSLREWLQRGFDLFGGIASEVDLTPLFE